MTREEYLEKIDKLNYYTMKYDEGNPEITDEEWDNIYFECKQYEEGTGFIAPNSPTNSIQFDIQTSLKKVTHNHPMLSLSKTKKIDEMKAWLKEPTIVMLKMDGLTLSLCYEDGKLISAETRGNGEVGEDVLHNAKVIPSIPKTIPTKERTIVDGEVICKYKIFEEFSDFYKNPRNYASGSIRLMDPNECVRRKLSFVAWDKITGTEDLDVKLQNLEKLGFEVVPYFTTDLANLETQQEEMKEIAVEKSYPIDGLVYKINNYASYMAKGYNEHDFEGGKAFKFYDSQYETRLLDINWSVGRTGRITPVAVFEPVQIDGTTVTNANMHNLTIMTNLLGKTPFKGQKIWVIKANMIIPQVVKSERS